MNRIFFSILAAVSIVACQKQPSEEERRAEVDRQVRDRLAAEHQQDQAQQLSQREKDLQAREQALSNKEKTPENRTPDRPAVTEEPEQSGAAGGSYSVFYNKLEPYGDWIQTRDYDYVFRPREASGAQWRPYTEGRWAYTDAGWTWISSEAFGWATYHYGRWTRLRGVGWVWVPGHEWAPAWVSWRKGNEYVGWAPLPPEAEFDRRSGIHNWSDNYYDIGPNQYVFVQTRELGQQRLAQAIVPEQRNVTIVNQTTNVTNITYNNNTVINNGPNYDEVRAQSQVPIEHLRLQRETSVSAANPHAEVQGGVVNIPAPMIAPRSQERPRAVKQSIEGATVERGWDALNPSDAQQARAKLRSEATPPLNAPSKKFARPGNAERPAMTAAPPSVPSATAAPTSIATAPPRLTPGALPATTAPPSAVATPAVRATPTLTPLASATARFTPRALPTATFAPSPPPISTATATPFLNPPSQKRERPQRPERSEPSPTASAAAPSPAEATTPSPIPTVSSSLTKRELKQEKRAEKRALRRGENLAPTPTPVP